MAVKTKTQVKIKPLGDRILVQRIEPETKTASGIYLPDSAKEKPQEAKVVAVGDGRLIESTGKRESPIVKVGDTVILEKWGGTEVKIDDEEYLIVRESDILAVTD